MRYESPWLTIIVPIYNAEKYLRKCLGSIAAQSFDNYEVIMVDDGSVDKSSEICNEYSLKNERFKYYRTENNGVLSARLFGAKQVNGQYFTYCDADDFYVNSKVFQLLFDKMAKIIEEISVVQFGFVKKYNHIRRSVRLTEKDYIVNAKEFYMNEYPKFLCSFWEQSHLTMSVWNKLYNSNLLKYLPEQMERVFWGDDLILNLHLLQSITNAYFMSDVLYVYQQSTGNTKRFSTHTMEDLDIIKRYQLKFLDKRTEDDTERIRKILYSEMAGWFLFCLKDAIGHLNDQELTELINDTLALPRFKFAHEFYVHNPEDWEAADLLKKADVNLYLAAANRPIKKTIKTSIIQILKTIYRNI